MARVAEKSDKYTDMVELLKEIIDECSDDLSIDIKSLLRFGLKSVILAQRTDLKTISSNKA